MPTPAARDGGALTPLRDARRPATPPRRPPLPGLPGSRLHFACACVQSGYRSESRSSILAAAGAYNPPDPPPPAGRHRCRRLRRSGDHRSPVPELGHRVTAGVTGAAGGQGGRSCLLSSHPVMPGLESQTKPAVRAGATLEWAWSRASCKVSGSSCNSGKSGEMLRHARAEWHSGVTKPK